MIRELNSAATFSPIEGRGFCVLRENGAPSIAASRSFSFRQVAISSARTGKGTLT